MSVLLGYLLIEHSSLTVPRASPRISNKNKDKLEEAQLVPQVPPLPLLHKQLPVPPLPQQIRRSRPTNPSTSSKPPPKRIAAEPAAHQLAPVVKAPPPQPDLVPAPVPKEQEPQPVALATSISSETIRNSSNYARLSKPNPACWSRSCSKWALAIRSWRS